MKYLVLILALAFVVNANAQFNAEVYKSVNVTTTVLIPLEGGSGFTSAASDFKVIKGQVRSYATAPIDVPFDILGTAGKTLSITFLTPADVTGVHLVGGWFDNNIATTTPSINKVIPAGNSLQSISYKISAIDATLATPASLITPPSFAIECQLEYVGI